MVHINNSDCGNASITHLCTEQSLFVCVVGPVKGLYCGRQSSEHILLCLQAKVFFKAYCGQA